MGSTLRSPVGAGWRTVVKLIEVALIGYRGANTGRQAGNTGRWDKSDGILGDGRLEVELSAGAKVVNVADDEKTTGALVDTTFGATAGVGTTAGAVERAVVLGAVTDVAATADGGTGTGALVDTTGGATAGASGCARLADKSTGGAGALVVTCVGIRGLDSSVDSVARGSNSDGRLKGPNRASTKLGELLPDGVNSSPRIVVSSSPSD